VPIGLGVRRRRVGRRSGIMMVGKRRRERREKFQGDNGGSGGKGEAVNEDPWFTAKMM
jgi:hypothetical protein